MRGLLAALAIVVSGTGTSARLPDGPVPKQVQNAQMLDLAVRLKALETALGDPAGQFRPLSDLIAAAGLTEIVHPPQFVRPFAEPSGTRPPEEPLQAQRLNMRLALTMLSQPYGSDDNFTVLAAQPGPDTAALILRKGRATMTDLRRLLREQGLQEVTSEPTLTLRVPLVIWAGATLDLGPGDVIALSRTDGAFLMNFGQLEMRGASIVSVGAANENSPRFTPFVTSADTGSVLLDGASIVGLGFGDTSKFSGFAVLHNALQTAHRPVRIENSRFENIISLSMNSVRDATIRNNRFQDMRGAALVVARSRNVAVLSNVFLGNMPTNSIRIEDGSSDGQIAGNIILGGKRAGITVRTESPRAAVLNNIIWKRDGSGITLLHSDCGRIVGNLVIDNDQKGIEVRSSSKVWVQQNTVLSNHSAGLWVSSQAPGVETMLQGNVLAANGSGLAAAAGEAISMEGNDFSLQFPQFLSGDLALLSPAIARNLRGDAPMVLNPSGTTRVPPAAAELAATDCKD